MSNNKKIMNFRYFLVLALSLICVISFFIVCLKSIILKIIFTVFLLLVFIIIITLFIKYRKKVVLIILSIVVFVIISNLNLILRQNIAQNYINFDEQSVVVSGRIASELTYTSSGNIRIYVDNVKISSAKEFRKTNFEIIAYINPTNIDISKLKIGNNISINSTFNIYSFDNLRDINFISKGVIGYIYSNVTDVTISDRMYIKFDEIVREFVYNKFCSFNMNYADIAQAMFFGKTEYIESDINDIFKETGTTHILAVSGMHITIIISIIHLLFRKFKISRKSELIALLITLPFYNYLCDFSISVVRASIMAIVSLVATIRHKKYNMLSSLSFTSVIVLMFNPLYLFNYSFILSFSTILIIVLLYPCIKRLTDNLFYNKFSSAFSLCLSTQIGIFFLQLYLFKSVSLLSFIANLVIIPLTTFAFEYLLMMFPLMVIISPLGYFSKLFDLLLSASIKFGNYITSFGLYIEISMINVLFPILSVALIFIISDYLFETKKKKFILSSIIIFVGIIAYSLSLLLV